MSEIKKPRIMFVVQSLVMGGAERLVLEISKELIRRNCAEVLVVGLEDKNEYSNLSKGIPYMHADIIYKLSVFGKHQIEINSLLKIIDNFKPDIIHTNCYLQEAPARQVIYKNIAYFSHLHDNMPAFRNLKLTEIFTRRRITEYFEKQRLINKYKKCNNTFIAISKDTFDYFKKNLPEKLAQQIVVLPNAIDFEKFCNRKIRSIDHEKTIQLINVGHFAPNKNQLFLLMVLKILKEKNIKVELKLIGDSVNVKDRFFQKAEALGVRDNLEMPGIVINVEDELKHADIYVHSSHHESFGLTHLEAMAAGLPVICLDAGGNRDIIEQGKNGYIVYEQNVELFAEKIIKLIEDKELYKSISAYAVGFARKYDIKEYVDKLIKLYQKRIKESMYTA